MIYEKYIKVLYINLDTGKIRIDNREDLRAWLGGVGVASKLLEENMKPELDALDPAQPIIFAIGAATTIFPVITKTVAMFRSPLTGELGESHAGGRLALTLFMAGYDAVVITGKSPKPIYLSVARNDVVLKDARPMWGKTNDECGRIIREREAGSGKRSIIRIGSAGENGVRFASVCVDSYRHFGRLGLGAVMGSKNLKAIHVIGDRDIPIHNFKDYFKVYQDIYRRVTDTEIMSKYHDAGTPINIEPLNGAGGLPTKNLRQGVFEYGDNISGDTFVQKNLIRKVACTGCPVGCIHIGQFRREFDEGHDYEAVAVGYDYELIFALGSFIGVKTSDEVLRLIEAVEEAGMDAMSTGVVLGWATEAFMRGLITVEQTLVPLAFGNTESYLAAIRHLAARRNEFYSKLGEGAYAAAQTYGGEDFAMTIGKNEMPGYHTGYGALIGAAVGARHSHLCNGGYSVDSSMKVFDKQKMVDALYNEEVERCLLNSLVICLFSRKVYDRATIRSVLGVIELPYTDEELSAIARRILQTKVRIKKAFGFNQEELRLPKRFFETPSMTGRLDESVANELMEMYQLKINNLMAESDAPVLS